MKKVLIIEDDFEIVELLEIHLTDLECQLEVAYTGGEGLFKALHRNFDLIILDVMLPEIQGLDICRRVRAKGITTPILFLTAKSEEIDKVLGLETGADDYLTKPFSVREFIARVKAIFRRKEFDKAFFLGDSAHILKFGDLCIDLEKRKVTLAGERVELSPKEHEILCLLASNPGKSYNRSRLLNLVWGYDFEGYEHTINSHINRLRAKIEPNMSKPIYILTTWGVGYRFNENLE